ncbi:unnamed protein product [Penicillium camemberti]|uniref:Str. FM013 n=1 Tax=Penicillium camemberti (strain FM 013) TaxID=1429867 RepID=A0A0G4PR79_PENC3|nr:unnamed protein product [Penicillium camemberti]
MRVRKCHSKPPRYFGGIHRLSRNVNSLFPEPDENILILWWPRYYLLGNSSQSVVESVKAIVAS